MTTVLDTNLLSELRLPNPDPNVSAWFAAQPQADLAIASFSVAEIEYGIARTSAERFARDAACRVAERHCRDTTDPAAGRRTRARIFGRLLAVPALRNLIASPPQARKPRFAGDLAIAATAVAHQAAVATRNVGDFRLIAHHCPASAASIPGPARRSEPPATRTPSSRRSGSCLRHQRHDNVQVGIPQHQAKFVCQNAVIIVPRPQHPTFKRSALPAHAELAIEQRPADYRVSAGSRRGSPRTVHWAASPCAN